MTIIYVRSAETGALRVIVTLHGTSCVNEHQGASILDMGLTSNHVLTFCVVYLDGVPPSPRASVHSRVTMMRTPFFLAMQVT